MSFDFPPSPTPGRPQTLHEALAQARRDLAAQRPSSDNDAAVLAQLRTLARPAPAAAWALPGARMLRRVSAWGGGGLLALVLVLGAVLVGPPGAAPAPAALTLADTGFMPLVSPEEWRSTLAQQAQAPVLLVPTSLPRERLALMGLPFDATQADQPVQAELMVHPSGQLLAVRFVQ
jgi:hypothetical protein